MRTQSEMTFTCLEDANPTLVNVFRSLNSCRRQRMHAILLHACRHASMEQETNFEIFSDIIVERGLAWGVGFPIFFMNQSNIARYLSKQ